MFSIGTDRLGGWVMSASNNAPGWPGNPGRSPYTINTTGWYTFKHIFRDNSGVLAVDMQVLDASGTVLKTWTLSDPADTIPSIVGGNRYGWFAANAFDNLPVDNLIRTGFCPNVCYADVANGSDSSGDGSFGKPFKTIQKAVNTVSAGGMVYALPGAYPESPVVNKSLTLVSTDGRDQTFIELQTGVYYIHSLLITGADVTVDGFTIVGIDAACPTLAASNIYMNLEPDNVTIKNNRLRVGAIGDCTTNDDGFGLITEYTDGPYTVNSLTVENNIFEPLNTAGQRAFYINPSVKDFTFRNNQIVGQFNGTSLTEAMNNLVEGNTITGTGTSGGFAIWGYKDPGVWGTGTFIGNDISGTANAISLYDTETVTVTHNILDGNGNGVRVLNYALAAFDQSTIHINNNALTNNTGEGILNMLDPLNFGMVDGTCNWWGAANGPGTVGPGSGDKVSQYVDFGPWLLSSTLGGGGVVTNTNTGEMFCTIQAAINDSDTVNGHTITVGPGTYPENVNVNKEVTIIGDDPTTTIVAPASGNGFNISADNVTLEKMTVTASAGHGVNLTGQRNNITFDTMHFINNGSRGIDIYNSGTQITTDVEVKDSLFDGNSIGIRMSSSTRVDGILIEGTTFKDHPSSGFYEANDGGAGWVKNLTVKDSEFTNNGTISGQAGIYAEEFSNVLIEDSVFDGNRYGINLWDYWGAAASTTTNVIIRHNTFENHKAATIALRSGTSDPNAQLFLVDDNVITQDIGQLTTLTGQIAVSNSTSAHGSTVITNNDVTLSGTFPGGIAATHGISLSGRLDNVTVEGNTLNGGGIGNNGATLPTSGVRLLTTLSGANDQVTMTNNTFTGFVNGVSIFASSPGGIKPGSTVKINRNDLSGNSGYGIQSGPSKIADGTCNWWGDMSGPGPVGLGSGDKVSNDVDFGPWLRESNLNSYLVTNDDTGKVFCGIQQAIDDGDTADNDTITVSGGWAYPYSELVDVYKAVHLIGAGAATTTIEATTDVSSSNEKAVIQVRDGKSAEITGFTIAGPGPDACGSILTGIFVHGGATANIHHNTITAIRDNDPNSACQNGLGILVGRKSTPTTGTATVTDNEIAGYQKGGIVVDNAGSSVTLGSNTITGSGSNNHVAQNGVQISRGATATFTGNDIRLHQFSGSTWIATGVLLYDAGNVTINNNNLIHDNGYGIYIRSTGARSSEADGPQPVPFDAEFDDLMNQGRSADAITAGTMVINDNQFYGNVVYGAYVTGMSGVDGRCNWWGNAGGPSGGNKVSGGITVIPFRTSNNMGETCNMVRLGDGGTAKWTLFLPITR